MQNENQNINAKYQTLVIVWGALLMSQLMLLLVLFFAKPEIFRFDFSAPLLGGDNFALVIALAITALTTFLLSFVLKKRFLDQAIQTQKPELVQTATVVACALCEAASLFGLVLAFAAAYQYFFVWFVLGIFGIALHFPKRDDFFAASYKK